jgi:hypothetical protein
MSKEYARRLYLAGRAHGMGANRLWARALEEGEKSRRKILPVLRSTVPSRCQ